MRTRHLTRTAGLAALLLAALGIAPAQQLSEQPQGLRDATPRWHALTQVRLVLAPGQVVENGVVVLRDGVITAAGDARTPVPAGARVWALPGRSVYAGFIDLAGSAGAPKPDPTARRSGPTRWVQADLHQASLFEARADEIRGLRDLGFTAALSAPNQGVFRGQSALLSLRDPGAGVDARSLVLATDVAQHLAPEFTRFDFETPRTALTYPTSLMGSIALMRQTWLNARWYGQPAGPGERRETNPQLAALAPALAGRQPVFFEAADEQDFERAAKLRDEFGLQLVAQGQGTEYRRAAQLKALALPVVVPLAYPAAPEVDQPESALDVPLQALQHWERAPSNLATLQAAGVEFAVSTAGLRDAKKDFWPRLRQAVRRGLKADVALAALTTTPAKLIGQPRLGRIAPGQVANLVVASGDLFTSEAAEVELDFVDGRPYPTEAFDRFDPRGHWLLTTASGQTVSWVVLGTRAKPTLQQGGKSCELQLKGRELLLRWPCDPAAADRETLRLEGRGDRLSGALMLADSRQQAWQGQRRESFASDEPAKAEKLPPTAAPTFPAGVFGRDGLPEQPAVLLVRDATIWTSGPAGRLSHADLLVRTGKIVAIGPKLAAPQDAVVIDAQGRHLTPGLIDAHSHTAVSRGINEFSNSVTAEVRIGDVIDATDINLYRQLAGGVTAANVLHGSANAIGGQNQVIKLRWGAPAEALKFEGARPGIKFALGENVKRANFPPIDGEARYPTTRMGVEQVMRDAFLAARQYQAHWAAHRRDPRSVAEPRRDLQMDTLVELLERKRVIHIHSYRADEILMFVRLSQEFGLEVATFQHVLEGYKVAKEIASIGAGASGFSDWWGYKAEVQDAIPYNGFMTQRAGVITSFNSDSDELARRLNTEAAKAVRYGGLSEEEALKFVTLNPAIQLRLQQRVGSLEVGKDADFVLWSAHPLSSAARAEQTWIDGRRYFDLADDARLRERDQAERARLIALAAPKPSPAATTTPAPTSPIAALLAELELQRSQHLSSRYRDSYWGGDAWHECTVDSQ